MQKSYLMLLIALSVNFTSQACNTHDIEYDKKDTEYGTQLAVHYSLYSIRRSFDPTPEEIERAKVERTNEPTEEEISKKNIKESINRETNSIYGNCMARNLVKEPYKTGFYNGLYTGFVFSAFAVTTIGIGAYLWAQKK